MYRTLKEACEELRVSQPTGRRLFQRSQVAPNRYEISDSKLIKEKRRLIIRRIYEAIGSNSKHRRIRAKMMLRQLSESIDAAKLFDIAESIL